MMDRHPVRPPLIHTKRQLHHRNDRASPAATHGSHCGKPPARLDPGLAGQGFQRDLVLIWIFIFVLVLLSAVACRLFLARFSEQ